MTRLTLKCAVLTILCTVLQASEETGMPDFAAETDLLSLHYDHAPDKDDGHSAAADRTILESMFGVDWIRAHVVAVSGAYGKNAHLFNAESNAVMDAAWNDCGGWLAAHVHREDVVEQLSDRWGKVLKAGGDIWVKEGGQSDVTADVIERIRKQGPVLDTTERIHVVQHSNWNEHHTTDRALVYVKTYADYIRIRDANAYLNKKGGRKGFVKAATEHPAFAKSWKAAFAYYKPSTRLDFSDTGELMHILGLGEMGVGHFKERYLIQVDTGTANPPATGRKPRIIVTTDGEIDDRCSMVRFLLYANEWDIEGLILCSSRFHWKGHAWAGEKWIHEDIDLYAQSYEHLTKHNPDFPAPQALKKLIYVGNIDAEGEMDKDTPGSNRIVEVLLDDKPGPVYLQAWGGTNTIARALWKIQHEYSDQMEKVSQKAIIFIILDQDKTFREYIQPNWPEVQVLGSFIQFNVLAYSWSKFIPKDLHRYFTGAWMKENILRGHGPLCRSYEAKKKTGRFISEGDSPAFMHQIDVGLGSLEHPGYGGWGGRFAREKDSENVWRGAEDDDSWSKPIWRWAQAFQNDWAARADWCVKSFTEANHNPKVVVNGIAGKNIVRVQAQADSTISLSAAGSSDPDGDLIAYEWWHYKEPGTYGYDIRIQNANTEKAQFAVPYDDQANEFHIILTVRDNGSPNLFAYRRVIVQASAPAQEYPRETWQQKPPRELGLHSAPLDAIAKLLKGKGCIIRHGCMVESWGNQHEKNDWFSSSKPVLSTLLLFAIKEERINSVDDRIGDFGWNLSPMDQTMTFRHLANMISGYARPDEPGAAWAYNDFAIMLYQRTLFEKVFQDSAKRVLTHPTRLGPLQFEDALTFSRKARLKASVRDFARLCWFWLNNGRWHSQQLLDRNFVQNCLKPDVPKDLPHSSPGETNDYLEIGSYGGGSDHFTRYGPGIYGFNFWFNDTGREHPHALTWPDAPPDAFMTIGALGNSAVIIPSLNIVIAAARANWGELSPGNRQSNMNRVIALACQAATSPERVMTDAD